MTTIRARGKTDVGRVRSNNEDHYFIGILHKGIEVRDTNVAITEAIETMSRLDADLLVVADGVGGSQGGERASQSAVFSLATYIARTAACHYDPEVEQEDEFLQRLERALEQAHQVVRSLATGARGPATTLTLSIVIGSRAYIAHAGDSRAYHFRRGRLRQITRDQTLANMLHDAGIVSTSEGANLANVLASAVGAQSMTPTVGMVNVSPGDWLLLCTDGLFKHVSDDGIAATLSAATDPEAACDQLVAAALAGGGTDNVTVVAALVEP